MWYVVSGEERRKDGKEHVLVCQAKSFDHAIEKLQAKANDNTLVAINADTLSEQTAHSYEVPNQRREQYVVRACKFPF